jgi:hypothetical protein
MVFFTIHTRRAIGSLWSTACVGIGLCQSQDRLYRSPSYLCILAVRQFGSQLCRHVRRRLRQCRAQLLESELDALLDRAQRPAQLLRDLRVAHPAEIRQHQRLALLSRQIAQRAQDVILLGVRPRRLRIGGWIGRGGQQRVDFGDRLHALVQWRRRNSLRT